MTIIRGISGTTATHIKATKAGELEVIAITETELEHFSASGESFAWPSLDTDIDAGDTRLLVKNTGGKFLVLSHAEFNPSNVVCKWCIGIGSEAATATGTAVTSINMNQIESSKVEDYVAFDDETAHTDAPVMFKVTTSTVESKDVSLRGIILGKNHYIQINQETESTSGQVSIFGYFTEELV